MKQVYLSINFFPYFILLFVFNLQHMQAQQPVIKPKGNYIEKNIQYDPETTEDLSLQPSSIGWGYSFDSLLNDISLWKLNPNIVIDTIGYSVQNRPLYELIITNKTSGPKTCRIAIHARTHPIEVQSTYVTKEIIKYLISDSENANKLLDKYIFSIVPQYNPDGVELGYTNLNANGKDIEGGWDIEEPQPEVKALRKLYKSYMDSPVPIRVALNMHSSVACTRYFVFHDSVGTSKDYTEVEKSFIEAIRSYWTSGFQDWNYYVSWTSGTPKVYPESWFWVNYNKSVIALTYEDMNCSGAGNYDLTASSLLKGINDFLEVNTTSISDFQNGGTNDNKSFIIFPNPVHSGSVINVQLKVPDLKIELAEIVDMAGRRIYSAAINTNERIIQLALPSINNGIYVLLLKNKYAWYREKFIVE